MFTGIVTHTAKALDMSAAEEGGALLKIERVFDPEDPVVTGESIAVDGCCLTVLSGESEALEFFVSEETLERTIIGNYTTGVTVNLERALSVGDRLGGHLVSGHVDCSGRLVKKEPQAGSLCLSFSYPSDFRALLIPKGSVAVNGVSLTVNELFDSAPEYGLFTVNVIPHTAEATNLGSLEEGDSVNIEFDLVGKYQQRARDVIDSLQNAPA